MQMNFKWIAKRFSLTLVKSEFPYFWAFLSNNNYSQINNFYFKIL